MPTRTRSAIGPRASKFCSSPSRRASWKRQWRGSARQRSRSAETPLVDLPALEVRRNSDIHFLRPRQVEARHDRDELVNRLVAAEPRVSLALLSDAADMPLLIVVSGIDQGIVGQAEDFAMHRSVERRRVPVLEIRAAAAVDQQRIAGEDHPRATLTQKIAVVIVGMAG